MPVQLYNLYHFSARIKKLVENNVSHKKLSWLRGFLKGTSGRKKGLTQMKEREKRNKTGHHRPQYAKWFSRYSISKSGIWARWTSPFCRFSASFSLKYDVTDAMLQYNEKMKVQYLRSLLFDCLKLCRLLELGKGISLHFKFCCYGNQNQNYCLLLKNKRSIVKAKVMFKK